MIAEAFPELVTGREDGYVQGPWEVRRGSTSRGGASCNLTDRVLEVPLGPDATSRIVRAHELMHVRVSPFTGAWSLAHGDVSPRALECGEEFRINTLLGRVGFETILLRDGSEKSGGRRVAEAGDWSEALCFLLAVLGTGSERDYLAGIRSAQPSWMPGLRAVRKRVLRVFADLATNDLADTVVNEQGVARGYAVATVAVATSPLRRKRPWALKRSVSFEGPSNPEAAERLRVGSRRSSSTIRSRASTGFAVRAFVVIVRRSAARCCAIPVDSSPTSSVVRLGPSAPRTVESSSLTSPDQWTSRAAT